MEVLAELNKRVSPVATGPADDQCTENMVRSWRPVTVVSSLQRGLPAGQVVGHREASARPGEGL